LAEPQLWAQRKLKPLIAFGRTDRLEEYQSVPIGRELMKSSDDFDLLDFAEMPFFYGITGSGSAENSTRSRKCFTQGLHGHGYGRSLSSGNVEGRNHDKPY